MPSTVLRIVALLLFLFAAFGFNPGWNVELVPMGLAFWCGSQFV